VVVDPKRLQLLVTMLLVGSPSAVAVSLASTSRALTRLQVPHERLVHDGHRLAPILLALAAASFLLVLSQIAVERVVVVPQWLRVLVAVAFVSAAAVGVVAAFAKYGAPDTIVRRGYHSFMQDRAPAKPQHVSKGPQSLNARLFTLRSNGRLQTCGAAWHEFQANSWTGSGAGDFGRYWLQQRKVTLKVSDAHSLYLETLGELGPIGLALLVIALGAPLVVGVRARRHRLVPPALGAYAGFLAHAGVDWDWEIPAVTFAGLLCAAALLAAGRRRRGPRTRFGPAVRGVVLVALVAAAGFSLVTLVGNRALAKSTAAVDAANWARGRSEARSAIRWLPWSAQAWQNLGDSQLGLGEPKDARRSLAKAARMNPGDWSIWFDLGSAEPSVARKRAYTRAAALNPLNPNIQELRRLHILPPASTEGG